MLTTSRSLVVFIAVLGLVFLSILFSPSATSTLKDHSSNLWYSAVGTDNASSTSPSKAEIYNCLDPYRRPGYLYANHTDYRKTRWIPYTSTFFDSPSLDIASFPAPPRFDSGFDPLFFESEHLDLPSTPKPWMELAVAENKRRRGYMSAEQLENAHSESFVEQKDEGGFDWLWGRRLLIVGDSVDRFTIRYFCEEFEGKWQQEWHVSGVCEIPAFNLTMVHWHIVSMLNYKPTWWEEQNMEHVAFEDRWENLWAETREQHVRGLNGRNPDLILWQSGLWDHGHFLGDAAISRFGSPTNDKKVYENVSDPDAVFKTKRRQLVWQEIRFMATRFQKLVSFLRNEFGADTPTMYRSLTHHIGEEHSNDAMLIELNRLGRAVAENAGHEMFEWGRIMNGFAKFYNDDTHLGKGPASWLWGNMFMEYLARSAGVGDQDRVSYFNGWAACHNSLVDWGGV